MGKFTAIQTYDRFLRLWDVDGIDQHSLNFILDTGLLYTHGIFINGAAYGTEANNAVGLTIAGTTKTLSLSSHTHSTYLEKNQNINIGAYKIVSGDNDLLYYSTNIHVGDTDLDLILLTNNPLQVSRNSTTYTILDTGNFSISNTTSTGYTLNNVAVFKYGSSTFQLDYIRRNNTSSTFDSLTNYTLAGTTSINSKLYGFITLYTDGTFINPSWALIRVNITDRTFEYRTSTDTSTWINLGTPQVPTNAVNVAGIVSAPTSANSNKVWKTDNEGNPDWREEKSYTFYNILFKDSENNLIDTYTPVTSPSKIIKLGNNIGISASDNIITLSATNTWKAASTSQEGYVPKLQAATTDTIATLSSEYVLVFNSGSDTTPVWRKLPSNAFVNTWTAWKGATASVDGTAGYMPKATSALREQFLRGDGTWCSLNNYSLPTATDSALGGVKVGTTLSDVTGYIKVHINNGIIYYKDTTYTFYNLAFLNGDTIVDTYKPTTTPSKTVKAGSNVLISASSNIITISATDTTYSGVSKTAAGLCPLLPNETTTEKFLRLDGTWIKPNYTAAANNGTFSIKSKIGSSDAVTISDFTANQSSGDDFTLIQGSNITFTNDTTNRTLTIAGTANTLYTLTLNGTAKGTSGGTDLGTFYAVATSDATAKDQVWMRNNSNNGYAWRTLGSNAFDSTAYLVKGNFSVTNANAMGWGTLTAANGYSILNHFSSSDGGDGGFVCKNGQIFMQIDGKYYQNEGAYRVLDVSDLPDSISLTTSSIALGNTGWTETGLTNSTTGLKTTGTYIVQITQDTGYYSGVFSWYAGTGGMAEEVSLHYAGNTTPTRLYMKTEGGKIYLAADDTISTATYTIKIRKLI